MEATWQVIPQLKSAFSICDRWPPPLGSNLPLTPPLATSQRPDEVRCGERVNDFSDRDYPIGKMTEYKDGPGGFVKYEIYAPR
jgi:hypothetical protein